MTDTAMPSGPRLRVDPSDRRVKFVILLGSTALHLAVFAVMALRILDSSDVTSAPVVRSPIYVEVEPRPMVQGERARLTTQITVPASAPIRPLTGPEVAIRAPALNRRGEDTSDSPSPPSPRIALPSGVEGRPALSSDSATAPWRVRPETQGDRVGRAYRLGAGGCRMMDGRLSPAEQHRCDSDFNAAAGEARGIGPRRLSPVEARREAEFARDGARALQRFEGRRAPLRPGPGIVGPADCVGSNFGIGCAGAHLPDVAGVDMRQGATTNIRQGSNKLRAPDR